MCNENLHTLQDLSKYKTFKKSKDISINREIKPSKNMGIKSEITRVQGKIYAKIKKKDEM